MFWLPVLGQSLVLAQLTLSASVIVSSAAQRRLARARTWLEQRNTAEEVVIVAATLDAANGLRREVARAKGAVFGWHRITFRGLAAALAAPSLAERHMVPVGQLGTEAVAARAVRKLSAQSSLGRYERVAEGPGFARAVAAVLNELRLAQVPASGLGPAAAELRPLFETYDAELADAGLTDWPGVLAAATAAARERDFVHPMLGLPTLLLDVPIRSPAEFELLRALVLRSPELLASIPADDTPTLARLRDGLDIRIEDLDDQPALGPGALPDSHTPSNHTAGSTGSLARLQHHLFKQAPASRQSLDEQVVVFSAPGESRECVEIARSVLALAHEGVAFDRIAVLLRSPEEYRAHLEEAFARAGVPALFRARHGPTRSFGARLLRASSLRVRRVVRAPVLGVPVAWRGTGRNTSGHTAFPCTEERPLDRAR